MHTSVARGKPILNSSPSIASLHPFTDTPCRPKPEPQLLPMQNSSPNAIGPPPAPMEPNPLNNRRIPRNAPTPTSSTPSPCSLPVATPKPVIPASTDLSTVSPVTAVSRQIKSEPSLHTSALQHSSQPAPWTDQEDQALLEITARWNSVRWFTVMDMMRQRGYTRSVTEIKRRHAALIKSAVSTGRPVVSRPWSKDEDEALLAASSRWVFRVRWRQVASYLEVRGYSRSEEELRERLNELREPGEKKGRKGSSWVTECAKNRNEKCETKMADRNRMMYDNNTWGNFGPVGIDKQKGTAILSVGPSNQKRVFKQESGSVSAKEEAVLEECCTSVKGKPREGMGGRNVYGSKVGESLVRVAGRDKAAGGVEYRQDKKGMAIEELVTSAYVPNRGGGVVGGAKGGKAMKGGRGGWSEKEDEILTKCLRRRKRQDAHWENVVLYLSEHGFKRSQKACEERAQELYKEAGGEEEGEEDDDGGGGGDNGRCGSRGFELPGGGVRKRPRSSSGIDHRRWTEEEHVLFVHCIARYASGSATWHSVADWMTEGGFPRTQSACQQRMKRVKELAEEKGLSLEEYIVELTKETKERVGGGSVSDDSGGCGAGGRVESPRQIMQLGVEKGKEKESGRVKVEEEVQEESGNGGKDDRWGEEWRMPVRKRSVRKSMDAKTSARRGGGNGWDDETSRGSGTFASNLSSPNSTGGKGEAKRKVECVTEGEDKFVRVTRSKSGKDEKTEKKEDGESEERPPLDPFYDSLSESDGESSLGDEPIRGDLGEMPTWNDG